MVARHRLKIEQRTNIKSQRRGSQLPTCHLQVRTAANSSRQANPNPTMDEDADAQTPMLNSPRILPDMMGEWAGKTCRLMGKAREPSRAQPALHLASFAF